MKISEIKKQDEPLINDLALSYGTIFDSIEWTKIFEGRVNRYGIYNNGDELIGGFITYREKKFGLSIYRDPPFTPSIGPFLKMEAKNPVAVMDIWKQTLSLMANFIEDLPYSVMSCSLNRNIIDLQPFIWKRFKVIPGYTYILDLSMSAEDIWNRMSSERRKNINKGVKDGLFVKKITDYELIKSLVIKTFLRQKREINEFYLNKILFEFANNENSYAFVTYNNGPIGCSFCIYDRKTAFYLLGGYDDQKKHHGAGTLSMWEAIKQAKALGLRYFDFEGSMIPQIEIYFRGFGGQLTPYFHINKAKLPLEIALKFFKRELF